jgi:hypothetical protein
MPVPARLTVLPQPAEAFRENIVVGHDGAAVAERGEILSRVEAEAAEPADRTCRLAPKLRAERLGAVLDDVDAALAADCGDRFGVRTLSVEVHGHHGAGPVTNRLCERDGIHRSRRALDVT